MRKEWLQKTIFAYSCIYIMGGISLLYAVGWDRLIDNVFLSLMGVALFTSFVLLFATFNMFLIVIISIGEDYD